ncbi:molybdopterin-guanine dinucleotide biosynthesis protein B [Clostridium sp. HV4-5-A1G]|jgi:molybdopterin-guanine dinucleotide biosynthesis protein B|uniref:molybdopterin-guanine dinucleotide biosynthesis protein B n=1 Tax=Clostridium sp. HV4-5-A1G TaxID=2004595 RepID=UPI0012391C2C|nr:molybdopterin-guanine dinucleotide biosynthesis protein B [Clostridium sp. HV4-5-A1G]KAA8676545.1 molybdopterin-guanine dinucleotide biosynthesis protein B [Clostridium sp. HV4-5-A1G]CAB1239709.1 Molybdopterin-guanine dinucleotide biosynthesis protein B [Clostridiaceae bacterium BL-3]
MANSYLNRKPVVSIISAGSNSGKTTLIEGIIKSLKKRGYKAGVIKYDVHEFQIDHPGKDTYRFAEAGADSVVIASDNKVALIKKTEKRESIEKLLELFQDMDIIIVEGFKNNMFPKIEVYRKSVNSTLIYGNCSGDFTNFAAVASDENMELDIPVLDLNNIEEITDFIETNFMEG